MKIVSIKEIAEHLGLSRNTVSKVLNGKPGVLPETEEKSSALHSSWGITSCLLSCCKSWSLPHLPSLRFSRAARLCC